jgi:parallel beta-helix repeat protein
VILEGNVITENEGEGVFAAGESRLELRSNQITKNNGDGISLQALSQALIFENELVDNTGDGIFVWESSQATIENNVIRRSWWQGITVGGSAKASIEQNEIYHNGSIGVVIGRTASVTLTENQISRNGWYGMNLVGDARVEAHKNAIFENLREGISLEGTAQVTLDANEIYNNRGCGILASLNVKLQGQDNQIWGNGADLCKHVPPNLRLPRAEATGAKSVAVPEDYPSIQEAIDAVATGGEVVIAAGTYIESVTIYKPVTLMAQGDGEVVLKARSDKATVVSVLPQGELKLVGLTLTGGLIGMMVSSGSAVIANGKLTANQVGLVALGEAKISIEESQIMGNFQRQLRVEANVKLSIHNSEIPEE